MISNQFNIISDDPEIAALQKLGNRVKILLLQAGHYHYEKLACRIGVGRILLPREELGGNVNYKNLLKIIKGLGVTPSEIYSEGIDD